MLFLLSPPFSARSRQRASAWGEGRRSSHLGGVDPELECHSPRSGHRKFVEIVMFTQNILQTKSVQLEGFQLALSERKFYRKKTSFY